MFLLIQKHLLKLFIKNPNPIYNVTRDRLSEFFQMLTLILILNFILKCKC